MPGRPRPQQGHPQGSAQRRQQPRTTGGDGPLPPPRRIAPVDPARALQQRRRSIAEQPTERREPVEPPVRQRQERPRGGAAGAKADAAAKAGAGVAKPRRVGPVEPRRRPPQRPESRPSAAARSGSYAGRALVGVMSLLVFTGTAYGYFNLKSFQDNLATTDVIGANAGERPADGALDILLVGMDSRTDSKGNQLPQNVLDELQAGGTADGGFNTDTMILMHIPNDGGKAHAISFPRDSYVDIAGGYGTHKLNSAYGYAKDEKAAELTGGGETDQAKVETASRQAGAKNLIETVQDLTGVTIDHYAEVNLVGFYEITKAVEGVDVCLINDVDDDFSGARFTAGQHTISGKDALAFVRQRHDLPMGDLDRVVRQQVFMAGLAKKILSTGVLTDQSKLTALISAVTKSIVLDKDWNILGFAGQMQGLTGGNIAFVTIPTGNPDLQTPEDGSAVEVDEDEVREFVKGLSAPPPGSSDPSGTPTTGSSAADAASVTVDVRNASGVPGLAAKVLQALVDEGFAEGTVDNASQELATSVVLHGRGGEAGAESVADALGGMEVQLDPDIPAGTARVFVGADYSGPGQAFAGDKRVALDGGRRQPVDPSGPSTSAQQPITADGVRCVN
ncbi:LCP family protein [Umezawaea beigongshangensis]|uniref:LCP family protein n=1 Tax=Umezawaea beigongshangensis TaxID=2780383 RepID=UPI0027DDFF89|nr:LCP family protein [Umezawaea beigongshangensis]